MGILSFLWYPAKQQTGVYEIINRKTRCTYVGATTQPMAVRWGQHRKNLRGNRHHNARLQADWNTYGARAFRFKVIEVVDADRVFVREEYWQRVHHASGECYNPHPDTPGSFKKSRISREAKLFLFRVMRGLLPKTKENIRTAMQGVGLGLDLSDEDWDQMWDSTSLPQSPTALHRPNSKTT